MTITWLGGSTIELHSKKQTALLNPSSKASRKNAQIIIYDRTDEKHELAEDSLMVDWPGEYDVSGFSFRGIESQGKKGVTIAYTFHTSAGNVAWMGEMGEYPSEDFIEALGEVHVLIVPVGDKDVLKAKDAFRLVEALEPFVVIPICYGDEREGLQPFIKEMEVTHPEAKKSFELKKSVFGEEQLELVILEPS
ncbi:MAG: MBL fold metallo-hydrolase [Candidatus Gracilibacteria bacterium]|nr:MBL fold metallo-hydrolase [bacterium]MDZ4216999.1 MBL fold metallo-hydrolase [Candidatus Gracilibacteria bacterium]